MTIVRCDKCEKEIKSFDTIPIRCTEFTSKNAKFQIDSSKKEINIQVIEELSIRPYLGNLSVYENIEDKINELIKAIKQLDDKIK